MRKLHTLFWLPGDYSLVPSGSIATVPHDPGVNDALGGIDAAFLAARGLRIIVMLPVGSSDLSNPDGYVARLTALKATLAAKGITPWAISLGDEMFDVCNYGARLSWPVFAGMTRPHEDMRARKQLLYPRLSRLYTLTKTAFPTIPTLQVETMFCSTDVNEGYWHPLCPDADIAAVDPYLWSDGCPWLGTGPLTAQSPVEKFGKEVMWLTAGGGNPLGITGAFGYGKPVVLIGQVFRDVINSPWHTLPTPAQSRWYFEWGVSQPQIIGLGWYSIASVPGLSIGLDQLPAHLAMVRGTMAEMAAGTPVADPLPSAAPAPVPVPAPTVLTPTTPTPAAPVTTLCTIAVRSDHTLVITGANGRVQTVTV